MTFRDHFSPGAASYATYRPTYPDALFAWLVGLVERHDLAWDCATGSGQAAIGLARHFERVIATDASQAQIANAMPDERVTYRVAPADTSGLDDESVDLVTVAQALHWLDLDAFYAEVGRVLRPRGVLAAWGYGLCRVSADVDVILDALYGDVLGPYWPTERRIVDEAYRTVPFPFDELAAPPFSIEREMTLEELAGYARTWSATLAYVERHRSDPVAPFVERVASLWGGPTTRRLVRWPIFLRVGRR